MIGRGGVGTVYRARLRETGAQVALKLLGPPPACDASAARRLAREFEALAHLHHPNVVRVYEAGVHEGYSFLAMELVEGLDLRSYLSPDLDDAGPEVRPGPPVRMDDPVAWSDEPETEGILSCSVDPAADEAGPAAIRAFAALMDEPETDPGQDPRGVPGDRPRSTSAGEARPLVPGALHGLNRAGRIARLRAAILQVCDGLAYVHARGLVHRDLKPSNIMVDDARRVRLMDFGLVKLAADGGSITQHGKIVGTYRYMAPEQARGEPVDCRADLYSLGVVLFELLSGRPPFTARRAAELWNDIVSRPPPAIASLNPGVDGSLALVAEQLLAKDPRERFQTAEEVAARLRAGR